MAPGNKGRRDGQELATEKAQLREQAQRIERQVRLREAVDKMHDWAQKSVAFAIMLKRRDIDPEQVAIITGAEEQPQPFDIKLNTQPPARLYVDTTFYACVDDDPSGELEVAFTYEMLLRDNGPIAWDTTKSGETMPSAKSLLASSAEGSVVELRPLSVILDGTLSLADAPAVAITE